MLTDTYLPGIRVDEGRLREINIKYSNLLQEVLVDIAKEDSKFSKVNIRSPQDIAIYLYDVKGLVYHKKGMRATNADALSYLEQKYEAPILAKIKRARDIAHFLDSFVNSIMENAVDGRIHANLVQMNTVTSRWASREPNLQQQPSRGDFGEFKEIFVADEGCSFIQSDYQQLEFRVAAFHCNDSNMIRFIVEGKDVHRYMASMIYNKAEEDVTKDERSKAKTGTFGKIYRQTPTGLSAKLMISKQEAINIHATFDRVFPGWEPFTRTIIKQVKSRGYVESYFGRIRRFPYITPANEYKVYNEAVNFPIQCDGHVICSRAGFALYTEMNKVGDPLWGNRNVVHDSILTQAPDSLVQKTIAMHKEYMETSLGSVPILIDTEVGKSWGKMDKV